MAENDQESPSLISSEALLRLLPTVPYFAWLDQATGWFWLHSKKNRIVNPIRKVLAVSEQIEVAELRTQIARHHRMQGYAPPRRVLLELCRQLPGCQVVNTSIRAVPPIDWRSVLRKVERTMVRVLKERGPIMPRPLLEEACVRLGILRATFYAYLSYSPVIARFASGVYGLPGASLLPGAIESLIPEQHRYAKVRLDHGWTPEGRVWISYRLSDAVIFSGVCSIPTAMKRFLDGQFTAIAVDGSRVGTLVCKGNSFWGLGPFFRRRGGEAGDCMVILFDLSKREATIHIGDDSLVAEYADATAPETSIP